MAQSTPWYGSERAQTLLADIVANPPAMITRKLQSWERWTRDQETVSRFDENDDRVDALHMISASAADYAMRQLAHNQPALRKLCREWPSVDGVILDAMGAANRSVAA